MAIRVEDIEDRSGTVDLDRDRQLVVRFQSGDQAAFDDLYRRYHARLVNYCVRRVGDRHAAEELAQEAFLKALRAMPRFAGERRFYPWMTVIAQRLCIDHHRRNSRVEPSSDIQGGIDETAHDEVFAAVDRALLRSAIDRLAPRHREIIDLRERHGWSYNRIADHLGVPLTTVEALLHRARKALRREYLAVTAEQAEHEPKVAHRFPALLGLGVLAEKLRGWLSALGPERLIPTAGAAAAGVAAIGLTVAPVVIDDGNDPAATAPTHATSVASTAATSTPTLDVAATGPTGAVSTPAAAGAAPTADGDRTSTPPDDAVDLGVATYYPGPEGDEYVQDRIDASLIQITLPLIGDVGIEPPAELKPLLVPLVPAPLGDTPEEP